MSCRCERIIISHELLFVMIMYYYNYYVHSLIFILFLYIGIWRTILSSSVTLQLPQVLALTLTWLATASRKVAVT